MVRDHLPIHRLDRGNGVPPKPFSCHSVENFGIFLANFDVSDRATLFPINKLPMQNILKVQFNNPAKIELRPTQGPKFLNIIQKNDHFIVISNESLYCGQVEVPFLKSITK